MAAILVIALRLIVPLAILRFPLAGAVVAMVLDAFDVVLVDGLAALLGEPGEFGSVYASLDKALDTWYLALELVATQRFWPEPLLRRTALALFAWRLVGVVAFEVTALRPLLFVFPNLFENVYLYVFIVRRWAHRLLPSSPAGLILVLVVLLVPKLAQEWLLHIAEIHPWQILKGLLGG